MLWVDLRPHLGYNYRMTRETIEILDISRHDRFLTPQEKALTSGTTLEEAGSNEWYRPTSIDLNQIWTIGIARLMRQFKAFIIPAYLTRQIEIPNRLVLSLEDLDPTTGQTLRDPRALAELDINGNLVPTLPDAMDRLFTLWERDGRDMGRRPNNT